MEIRCHCCHAAGEALDSQGDGAMVEKGTGLRATQLLKLTALNSSLTEAT